MRVLALHLCDHLKSKVFGFEAILRASGWHEKEIDRNSISSIKEFRISSPDAAMKFEIQKAVAEYARARPWIAYYSVKFEKSPYYAKSQDVVVVKFDSYPVSQQVIDILQRIHSVSDHVYTLYESGAFTISVNVADVYYSSDYHFHIDNEGPETCLIGVMHAISYLTGKGFEQCSERSYKLTSPVYQLSNKPIAVNSG